MSDEYTDCLSLHQYNIMAAKVSNLEIHLKPSMQATTKWLQSALKSTKFAVDSENPLMARWVFIFAQNFTNELSTKVEAQTSPKDLKLCSFYLERLSSFPHSFQMIA